MYLFFRNCRLSCNTNYTHNSRILKMAEMKIKPGVRYKKNRVMSGHAPHKMLKMAQQKLAIKIAKEEAQ